MLKAVLVILLFAAVVYVTVRLLEARRGDDPGKGVRRPPLAPDDDPEFLRQLDRKRRRDQP